MELMTSGEFARASGLSRKALRLYDELGLLHPAQVAPATQYRLYAPAQLEQARLVAWLRRLGMPLAMIRSVTHLPSAQAARELAAYWEQIEAETAARRELATFLIGYLSGKDAAMQDHEGTLAVRGALAAGAHDGRAVAVLVNRVKNPKPATAPLADLDARLAVHDRPAPDLAAYDQLIGEAR